MQAGSISSIGYWQVTSWPIQKLLLFRQPRGFFTKLFFTITFKLHGLVSFQWDRSWPIKKPVIKETFRERFNLLLRWILCHYTFHKISRNLKFSSVFIDWSLLESSSNWSGWLIINSLSYWFFCFSIVGWLQQIPSYSMHFYGWKT